MKIRNFFTAVIVAAAPALSMPALAGPVADDMKQTGHDMKLSAVPGKRTQAPVALRGSFATKPQSH